MTQKEGNISVEGSTISSTALDWVTWDETNGRMILHKKGTGADAGFPFSGGGFIKSAMLVSTSVILMLTESSVEQISSSSSDSVVADWITANSDIISATVYQSQTFTLTFLKDGYYSYGSYSWGEPPTLHHIGETIRMYKGQTGFLSYFGETSPFPIALVPAMTSNTTPSGVCFSSGSEIAPSRPEWYAFDNNSSTMFHSSQNTAPFFVGYNLPSAKKVEKVTMTVAGYPASGQTCPARTFTIQGSNNNTSWTDLGTISVVASSVSGEEQIVESSFSNNTAYTYYRLYCDEAVHIGATWSWQFITIQFYSYE